MSETIRQPAAGALLAWYDANRRTLPWRAEPGERADPYRVWLSEIMLQQTNVTTVKPYFAKFLDLFPTVEALAAAAEGDVMAAWAGLGYYSRARNLHACAKAVVDRGGFPSEERWLLDLPGIGPYTAAAIASIAFGKVAAAVDGNVERVMSRVHAIETAFPAARSEVAERTLAIVPKERPGDFAQAMMDLGSMVCRPTSPKCGECPWAEACVANARGEQERFPVKLKKSGGEPRYGVAYVARRRDGAILLRTRPGTGLLGGMAEVPVSDWTRQEAPASSPPLPGPWRVLPGSVKHVFTHFPLELAIWAADLPMDASPPEGTRWVAPSEMASEALPSLMRKVVAHADKPALLL